MASNSNLTLEKQLVYAVTNSFDSADTGWQAITDVIETDDTMVDIAWLQDVSGMEDFFGTLNYSFQKDVVQPIKLKEFTKTIAIDQTDIEAGRTANYISQASAVGATVADKLSELAYTPITSPASDTKTAIYRRTWDTNPLIRGDNTIAYASGDTAVDTLGKMIAKAETFKSDTGRIVNKAGTTFALLVGSENRSAAEQLLKARTVAYTGGGANTVAVDNTKYNSAELIVNPEITGTDAYLCVTNTNRRPVKLARRRVALIGRSPEIKYRREIWVAFLSAISAAGDYRSIVKVNKLQA